MSSKRTYGKMTSRVRALIVQGYCNKEISALLDIGYSGVNYHVMKMYREAGIAGSADCRRFMIWLLTGKKPWKKVAA